MLASTIGVLLFLGHPARTEAAADSAVVFSEIQYHPAGAADSEWVELHCLQGVNVDLSGWRIEGGINYTFAEGTVIPGRRYFVIAANPGASNLAGVNALGPFTGALNNSGEEIRLVNRSGRIMDLVDYSDGGEWPVAADGSGVTLARRSDSSANERAASWTWSAETGGSPGRTNFSVPGQSPIAATLLTLDSTWKYRDVNSAPPADWKAATFDDSAWSSGGAALYAGNPQLAGGAAGLAGYWSFNETSGTVAQNAVSGGSSGQLNGSVSFVADATRGRVLQLNGNGAYVNAGSTTIPQMTLTNDFTWAFWANSQSASGSSVILGNRYSPTGSDWNPREFIKFTQSSFEYHRANGGEGIGYAALPVGQWVHHAVVKRGANISYFRGGSAAGSATITAGLDHPQPLYFGGDKANESWAGKLDDAAIWNKALTSAQIAALAAGTATPLNVSNPAALQTQLQPGSTAYYFRQAFTYNGSPARTALDLRLLVDDGAAVYLNGTQVHAQNLPAGPIAHTTLASSEVVNAALTEPITIPAASLVKGQNVLAVEVHQRLASNDPDLVFAAQLAATEQPPQAPDAEPGITINEISAGGAGFKIELTNLGSASIDLGGYSLKSSTGASYTLGSSTLDAGGFLVLTETVLGFTPVAGEALFLFKNGGVELSDARAVSNKLRGRGPNGKWLFPRAASFGGANAFTFNNAIVINEIMYHARGAAQAPFTPSPEQWIELFNRSTAAVDLSGWRFTSGIDFTFPSGTAIPAGGYLVVANDAAALKAKWPNVAARIVGDFGSNLSGKGELLALADAMGNPVNELTFADGGRWPAEADGGGPSLELRDAAADNAAGEAWGASDEAARGSWQNFSWQGPGTNFNGNPTQWNEFIFGLLDSGTYLIDDISVKDVSAGNTELIANGGFENGSAGWRFLGTQRRATVVNDPSGAGKVLQIVSTGATEHMHNHAETTLKAGGALYTIKDESTYAISFRARWVSGNNLLNARLYFNRLARTLPLPVAEGGGTPGAPNSTAVANLGPTYSALRHSPAVPAAGQSATVTAVTNDPDGIASANLFYAVDGGAFTSVAMTLEDGKFSAVIPGQNAGAKVQFYVQARDGQNASSFFPAGGSSSRALIPWDDGEARLSLNGQAPNNLRIVMTENDTAFLHEKTNVMSNDPLPGTVILNESEVFYNCGVHLRGSERGRAQDTRVSFNVDFPRDHRLYGTHDGVSIDRSGAGNETSQKEILIKRAINHAGGIPGSEDDLCRVIAPRSAHTGPAILVKQRFDSTFLDNSYANGSEGSAFKYEFIYYPQQTTGTVEDLKLPEPDDTRGVGVNSLGADKEQYRWYWLQENRRDADDYSGLIPWLTAFGRPADEQFFAESAALMDVDEWLRCWAMITLFGVLDNYGGGSVGHNLIVYQRPEDERWLFFPHDMDFSFTRGATESITENSDLVKLIGDPGNRRAYYGHLLELCTTTYNSSYLRPWAQHYSAFLNEDLTQFSGYIDERRAFVLREIEAAIPTVSYGIITPDGTNSTGSSVTIRGTAWVNMSELRLAGAAGPLSLTWIDDHTWEVQVPVAPGSNTITIIAYDVQGAVIGTDTVEINGTGSAVLASAANLTVSEIMYHPGPVTAAERAAGLVDADEFDFIEVQNISATEAVNLSGVQFVTGITFTFPNVTLSAGARGLIVANTAAFQMRYGRGLDGLILGQYGPNTGLANGGEQLVLVSSGGQLIRDFSYDNQAPWPEAEGTGSSLVLINPRANPDLSDPVNWRLSGAFGGSPGVSDATRFSGNASGDDNADGVPNFLQYAMAGSTRFVAPKLLPSSAELTLQFRRNLAAEDVRIALQSSSNLTDWEPASEAFVITDETPNGDGTSTVTVRGPLTAEDQRFFRLQVVQLP